MAYGVLTTEMQEELAKVLSGRVVHDLGAGDCEHARTLLRCGALRVVAIDKAHPLGESPPGVQYVQAYLEQVPIPDDLDVVFLGWPVNHRVPGLDSWVTRARTVIYLGHNFDGTACGTEALFRLLLQRRLGKYIPDQRNTLMVLQEVLPEIREPTLEEIAAFSPLVYPSRLNLAESPVVQRQEAPGDPHRPHQ